MSDRKLELIHVIFRHGERTPDEFTFYRKENETNSDEYYPYGIGQLTNKGKKDMYDLGEDLRRYYNDFLGDFLPKHVDAMSSEFERCRTSLQVLLAGLYPPKKELIWNDTLLWQPIPTKYIMAEKDMIILGGLSRKYREMYKENFKNSVYGQKLLKDYKDVLSYVKEHTGLEMYDTCQVFKVHDCIKREQMFNVHPKWATDSVMSQLRELAHHELNVMMIETDDLKRLYVGSLLEKIAYDSKQKIQGTSTRKIHLYGGHDLNVIGILSVFEVLKPHHPQEGSCVVVELYSTPKGYEIEVKYKSDTKGSFDTQPFPDGQPSWSFGKIDGLLKKYGPKILGYVPEERIAERVFTK